MYFVVLVYCVVNYCGVVVVDGCRLLVMLCYFYVVGWLMWVGGVNIR